MSKIESYLQNRGCRLSAGPNATSKVKSFAIPGEEVPGGRFRYTDDGRIQVWHARAVNGLALGGAWERGPDVTVNRGDAVRPSWVIARDKLDLSDKTPLAIARPERTPLPQMRVAESDMRMAAHALLEQAGYVHQRDERGLERWTDAANPRKEGSLKLAVNDGIATVFSYRGDAMPAPWQQGREINGYPSYYITGKDIETAPSIVIDPSRRAEVQRVDRAPDPAMLRWVEDQYQQAEPVPANHRHLTKGGKAIEPRFLVCSDNPGAQERKAVGDVLVPLFRPVVEGERAGGLSVELCGAQRLLKTNLDTGNDKLLLRGSKMAGAFAVTDSVDLMDGIPAERSMQDWLQTVQDRIQPLSLDAVPLVICEGVMTAAAIEQSDAGVALAALSAGNLQSVAVWAKESGLADKFGGLVIAADLDTGRHAEGPRKGQLKSNAVELACQAAEACGAKVALADPGFAAGTDARDIFGVRGAVGVKQYIAEAVEPAQVRQRPDLQAEKPLPRRRAEQDLGR